MASDEEKRAQKLVDEAEKRYLEAKSKEERRQWAETQLSRMDVAISLDPDNDGAWDVRGVAKLELGDYQGAIDDCTKAIELNPKNDMAWNNRGSAKYHLSEYQEAITYYKEALRLNPNDEAVRRNLQAAEIAFASHESAKKLQENKKIHHKRLDERAESHQQNYEALIKEREALFNSITSIIIIFITMFIIIFYCYILGGEDYPIRNAIGDLNFLTLWPYFILLFISLSPLVLKLRLNIQDTKRELVLKEDFYGRYIVEVYLDRFFSAEKDRRQFTEKYISYWMHNNPSETLLRLDKKSPDQSDAAQIDIMRELIRSQNTPS